MPCPHGPAAATTERHQHTSLGDRTCRCQVCRRVYNARTGTPVKHLQDPTDLVLLVVVWRLRSTLRLRDLAEMVRTRGIVFTHAAVREWEARFAPLRSEHRRPTRRGPAGTSWSVDETYITVRGAWWYLYRALDRDGNLVDVMRSETRDMRAAQACFQQAVATPGQPPERVTTDGHTASPRAVREVVGEEVQHRTSR